jgi:hypothetical protein
VLRAKGHKNLLVKGYAIMRPKNYRSLVAKVKVIAIRVPDIFIGKTEREEIRAFFQREG